MIIWIYSREKEKKRRRKRSNFEAFRPNIDSPFSRFDGLDSSAIEYGLFPEIEF